MAKFRSTLVCAALLGTLQVSANAQATPQDVPQSHWAYGAVQDLAGKGLIKGYPPNGNFFGGRSVTRYEMATILQRVLARVDDLVAAQSGKGGATGGVTPEQLAEVRRLVDEFRVELTVIGTDLQKVKDDLEAVKTSVADLTQQQADLRQGLQAAIDATQEQANRIDRLNSAKVDNGFGRIKVDGLLQEWIQSELNSPDRGVASGFRLRRAEIKLSGTISPKSYWTVMIDPAKALAVNTTSSSSGSGAGTTTSVTTSVNNASLILQDTFVGLQFNPELAAEVGQQKVPMSMEGLRSSAQLLTVERAIFNTLPTDRGRVGDIRDIGALLRLTTRRFDGQFGVFNDGGNNQNNLDFNNAKEVIGHLQAKILPNVMIGAYGEISGGVGRSPSALSPNISTTNYPRSRVGVEGSYARGRHLLEGEYVWARDGAATTTGAVARPLGILAEGGYALYGYRLSPSWQFIARGEYWNPDRDLHGAAHVNEFDLTIGANYYLNGHNSKIQLNYIRKNINGPNSLNPLGVGGATFLGADRELVLVNFQQAF